MTTWCLDIASSIEFHKPRFEEIEDKDSQAQNTGFFASFYCNGRVKSEVR